MPTLSEKDTVLIIDDEVNNIKLLKIDLEQSGYRVLSAGDGVSGWDMLQQNKQDIKAILLDRMMPNMNGMQFILLLKETPDVSNIPVIMQTAAAQKEQVEEGIRAGAYYYLTKPYEYRVMLSVVRAAIADYVSQNKLLSELKQFKRNLHIIDSCHFSIQSPDDALYLSAFLSNFYPEPERVVSGISELLMNAIEHGNLNIGYEEKTILNNEDRWTSEIYRRLNLPENKDKFVRVYYVKNEREITLTITDQGDGFEWEEYLELSASRALDNHGRGIALSKMLSFDSLEYIGQGNIVICKTQLPS